MPDEMMLHGNWIGSLGKDGDDAAKIRMKAEEPNLDGQYDQALRAKIAEFEATRAHNAAMAAKMEQRGRAICEEALRTINGERQDQYGNPEDTFAMIADLWTTYLGADLVGDLSAHEVADMMCLLKIAREKCGKGKKDNVVDLIGYAALGARMRGYDK